MIKSGQIYREKQIPEWSKNQDDTFVITGNINTTSGFFPIIYSNGSIEFVGKEWIEGDCELIATYPNWHEATSSFIFNTERIKEENKRLWKEKIKVANLSNDLLLEVMELRKLLHAANSWLPEPSKIKRGYTQLQSLKRRIREVLNDEHE